MEAAAAAAARFSSNFAITLARSIFGRFPSERLDLSDAPETLEAMVLMVLAADLDSGGRLKSSFWSSAIAWSPSSSASSTVFVIAPRVEGILKGDGIPLGIATLGDVTAAAPVALLPTRAGDPLKPKLWKLGAGGLFTD